MDAKSRKQCQGKKIADQKSVKEKVKTQTVSYSSKAFWNEQFTL